MTKSLKSVIKVLYEEGYGEMAELLPEYHLDKLFLAKRGKYVQINTFRVRDKNKGYGTRLMNDLTILADAKGWILTLSPCLGLGATSVSRLKKFYKRFGFVENKGRNSDFAITDTMYRKPQNG